MDSDPSVPDDPLAPRVAPVAPRARRPGSTAALPLEQLVLPILQSHSEGRINIIAGPGEGKTTALKHLRAVIPQSFHIRLVDTKRIEIAARIVTSKAVLDNCEMLAVFELCPWTLDDCLEYLVAVHRPQCASVLSRLKDDPSLPALKGNPQLLTLAMDSMARDSSIASAREALRIHISNLPVESLPKDEAKFIKRHFYWFRHDFVKDIYTASQIAGELSRGSIPAQLNSPLVKLIPEFAAAIRTSRPAIQCLEKLVKDQYSHAAVPMAVSILLRLDPDWRPSSGHGLRLTNAELPNARWAGLDLSEAILSGADFSGADLNGANLTFAFADSATFDRANLRGARLDQTFLENASFQSADLSDASAVKAKFSLTNLKGANLFRSILTGASFEQAVLDDANCQWADFSEAILALITVSGANFQSASFSHAQLHRVDMTEAQWTGAAFPNARLLACNLEGLQLPYVNFQGANLLKSLLTATLIPGGKFANANLEETGLAHIEWENADLRGANFTKASFHLGSTRSGLVGSIIPCEGSRTGFYTDDFNEQDFKSPEEIRKACLVGANLRGAKVEGSDFYLVDLRRALYSKAQAEHFSKTGAILVSRAR